jgi:hypothetical protein
VISETSPLSRKKKRRKRLAQSREIERKKREDGLERGFGCLVARALNLLFIRGSAFSLKENARGKSGKGRKQTEQAKRQTEGWILRPRRLNEAEEEEEEEEEEDELQTQQENRS